MSILGDLDGVLHDLLGFVDWVGTGGHVAGFPADVRRAASQWRGGGDGLDALTARLDGSVALNIHLGAGGAWNDGTAQLFQGDWSEVRAGWAEYLPRAGDVGLPDLAGGHRHEHPRGPRHPRRRRPQQPAGRERPRSAAPGAFPT